MPSGLSPPPGLGIITRRTIFGLVRLVVQLLPEPRQPLLRPRRLDLLERHPVHAARAAVGPAQRVGVGEDVRPVDLVVELVEAEGRLLLGLEVQLALQSPDLVRSCQAHRQSPSTVFCLASTPEVRPLPSAVVTRVTGRLRLPLGTMGLSDSRPIRRLPRRSPPVARRRSVGPLTLHRGPCARAVVITPAAGSGASVGGELPDPRRPSPVRWRLGAASSLSRPARRSLTLRPVRSLPRRIPRFARSFDPAGYPAGPSGLLPRRTDNSSDGSLIRWSSAPLRDAQRTHPDGGPDGRTTAGRA